MTATIAPPEPYAPPDGIHPFLAKIAASHRELEAMPDTIVAGMRCPLCDRAGHWRKGVHFEHERICFHGGGNSLSWEPGAAVPNYKKRQAIRDRWGPRLVFADWLEERGDPWGEFLRVGVELANHRPEKIGWTFLADGTSSDAESRAVNDQNPVRERLQRRHDELLARHGAAWARVVLDGMVEDCETCRKTGLLDTKHFRWCGPCGGKGYIWPPGIVTIGWHGGLPTDFTLSLDAWMGGIGPALLAAAPVRAKGLRFAGKEPHSVDSWNHYWNRFLPGDGQISNGIPAELFNLLDGYKNSWGLDGSRHWRQGKAYPGLAAAHDALARAAIRWATQQAKGATSR